MAETDLSTYVLEFGKKHAGERIQRVPASYLMWMVGASAGPWQIAQLELDRRSIKLPTVEVSHHAIDSASLRIRRTWHETREKEEGLYTWLARMTEEAIEKGERGDEGEIVYLGVKWVITEAGRWPTLKTVIPMKRRE
jgi:hypothetical protein